MNEKINERRFFINTAKRKGESKARGKVTRHLKTGW
jgi:hypothetical protein